MSKRPMLPLRKWLAIALVVAAALYEFGFDDPFDWGRMWILALAGLGQLLLARRIGESPLGDLLHTGRLFESTRYSHHSAEVVVEIIGWGVMLLGLWFVVIVRLP